MYSVILGILCRKITPIQLLLTQWTPHSHSRIGFCSFFLFFNGHGVVALKCWAFVLEFRFEETDVCPRQIDVFEYPYCFKVGFVFCPRQTPRCWQKWFSTMSELTNAGVILSPAPSKFWHMPENPVIQELISSLVSNDIKCLYSEYSFEDFTSSSQLLKKCST